MNRKIAEQILQTTFGLNFFYDNQWIAIEKILQGKRVLLIEKTGFGKSLCYQFPATQLEGTCIIFSPLIALMRDQVNKLKNLGISASLISSQQSKEENEQTIQDAITGKYKMIYIHPARMENAEWLEVANQLKISMVVVDEAHCISTWGHDFIPSYQKIIKLVNLLPKDFPVLAVTATATKRVEEDIQTQISKKIDSIRGNLLRKNLELNVILVQSEDEKMIWLAQNLNLINGTGIIYTGTRANTEIYSKWLNNQNISSVHYHSELDTETKESIEVSLRKNEHKCIVSTNALGMGIDKPDLRFIIHTQVPVSPIHYYQEIGRAGRDGKPASIFLFYNPNEDKTLPLSFIEGSRPSISKYERVINELKKSSLGLHDIIKSVNLKQTEVNVILNDLKSQQIIVEVLEKRSKKYEYKFNAPILNTAPFEELKKAKKDEFNEILNYIHTEICRMKFLCDFLGDIQNSTCGVCDNCKKQTIKVDISTDWQDKLNNFKDSCFPILPTENKTNNLSNGVAASYYGFSKIGNAIHNSKYKNGGDFPDWLVQLTLKAFYLHLNQERFDYIYFVPPTESRDLVKNFAKKISTILAIEFSENLIKIKTTRPQKNFQSAISKKENIKNVFTLKNPNEVIDKTILLIDDVYDSGSTIKEIGNCLSKLKAKKIVPLVIAKTVGGNI